MTPREFADPAEYAAASEFTPPEDVLEPEEADSPYRESSKHFMGIIMGCIQYLRSAKTAPELSLRLDVMSFAFAHPAVSYKSLADLALLHGKKRATVSAQLLTFQRSNGLPPTFAQKSTESRASYSDTRKAVLK